MCLSKEMICFPLCLTVDEEDEYECVTVVNSHTQDVKHVVWHPNQEVGHPLCYVHRYDFSICCTIISIY